MTTRLLYPLVFICLLSAPLAQAQPSETDRSLAQSLFEQGKDLMAEGKYAAACPKLAESQRLDPGGGTLLNLALCHEEEGKIATAWTDFKAALSVARSEGRADRVRAAEEHIAALEPKLPWLTVSVAVKVTDLEVLLDGAAFGDAAWGTPLSVDPGSHELTASAPGRKPWTSTVTIGLGERKTATVPDLEAAPLPPSPPPAAPKAAPTPTPQQQTVAPGPDPMRDRPGPLPTQSEGSSVAGWVIGGAGVVAIGAGSYFGVRALSLKKQSDGECPTDTTCSGAGVTWNDQANQAAWVSNFGIGLGLVGVAVGTYLLLSGETSEASSNTVGQVFIGGDVLAGGGRATLQATW